MAVQTMMSNYEHAARMSTSHCANGESEGHQRERTATECGAAASEK